MVARPLQTSPAMLRVCSCGRHVRGLDPACPFCGALPPSAVDARISHRSRAALFASVGILGVACGARTDIGAPLRGDASEREDVSVPDASPEQCVNQGGHCTDSTQCCNSMACQAGQCAYVLFYGGPFPDE